MSLLQCLPACEPIKILTMLTNLTNHAILCCNLELHLPQYFQSISALVKCMVKFYVGSSMYLSTIFLVSGERKPLKSNCIILDL